jgi:hypothetical protein
MFHFNTVRILLATYNYVYKGSPQPNIPRPRLNTFVTSNWYNDVGATDAIKLFRYQIIPLRTVRWHPILQALIMRALDLCCASIEDMPFSDGTRYFFPSNHISYLSA